MFACSDHGAAAERGRLCADAARGAPGQLPQETALHTLPVPAPQPACHPAELPALQGGGAAQVLKGRDPHEGYCAVSFFGIFLENFPSCSVS